MGPKNTFETVLAKTVVTFPADLRTSQLVYQDSNLEQLKNSDPAVPVVVRRRNPRISAVSMSRVYRLLRSSTG